MRLLLVEDDPALGPALAGFLQQVGHVVDHCRTLNDATSAIAVGGHDAIVLDLRLPDGHGLSLLQSLSGRANRPAVLILTALDGIRDRIRGLDAGADDYLVKPFDLEELEARLRALERRATGLWQAQVQVGALRIDMANRLVSLEGQTIVLTGREWALLSRLAQQRHRTYTRAELEDALYDFDSEIGSNTVEVHISHLRKKLGKDCIVTLRGLGYRLGDEHGPVGAGDGSG